MPDILLISGLSGAGKSTILHSLEDAGFFCTDNLPLEMLQDWATSMQHRHKPAAVCLDARSGFTATAIKAVIEDVQAPGDWQLLFVEAEDAVLQRRFSTLRRRHPFHADGDLMASILQERTALRPIRDMADMIFDSSHLTPYELAEQVDMFWRKSDQPQQQLSCSIVSFSYKHGLPANADIVFDMRFLPNPHYQDGLAELTGRDQDVVAFLQACPEALQARTHIQQWLRFIWPHLRTERKQYFTLAFGCSGGRHRSVYMAETIAAWVLRELGVVSSVQHRELGITEHTVAENRQRPDPKKYQETTQL